MAQFMQPLACLSCQSPATGLGQIRIASITISESCQSFWSSGWKEILRRLGQLLLKEAIKSLAPALQVGTTAFNFQSQCLLKRLQPGQQFTQLVLGQSSDFRLLGLDELCQGVRASRSRQRRSQWRC